MMRVMVWEWVPEEYTPRCICGPDTTMRDSLHARFGSTHSKDLFGSRMIKLDRPADDAVVCSLMNAAQKRKFLALHCRRYGYKIAEPDQYLPLVRSIEGVEFAICLAQAGEGLSVTDASRERNSLGWEFRLRNNFPQVLMDALSR